MEGPRETLRRAAENRRAQRNRSAREEPNAQARQAAPEPHHATYTALMHSHDRMRTRHLPEQGGGKRA